MKEYGTQNLDWLPDKLPENVKIVLSVADDSLVFTEIQKKVKNLSALIPVSSAHNSIFMSYQVAKKFTVSGVMFQV